MEDWPHIHWHMTRFPFVSVWHTGGLVSGKETPGSFGVYLSVYQKADSSQFFCRRSAGSLLARESLSSYSTVEEGDLDAVERYLIIRKPWRRYTDRSMEADC